MSYPLYFAPEFSEDRYDLAEEFVSEEDDGDILQHYGTPRHSGRYPWGSGENPYQHCSYFMSEVNRMRKEGMTDKEIWTAMNMSSGEFRAKITISKEQIDAENTRNAYKMKAKGYSNDYIAETLGVSEGTVRNYFKKRKEDGSFIEERAKKSNEAMADHLKEMVDGLGMIDVGTGAEKELQISDTALDAALERLKQQGYEVHSPIRVEQMTNPGKYTTLRVLAKPGITKGYIYDHLDEINPVVPYDQYALAVEEKHPGFERTKFGLYYPQSISRDRILVKYASDIPEENGAAKDGVIEIRRGVEDLSLGKSNYAQVRIGVDDKYYLKGMAIYSDNMPDGVDVIFNSHKAPGTPDADVFKKMKADRNNPFGAAIKPEEKGGQRFYLDEDGNEHLSAVNIVNSEGDWGAWSKTLSSQFLSKQNNPLIQRQLDLSYANKLDEYSDICSLTNPTIKKKLLMSFADDCDASAVHLKAASLPGQRSHVILPVMDIKENEIYAPNYKTGDKVVLIRYPHAATFEIPELTVNNNKHSSAAKLIGTAPDAVGISLKTAQQLSGADFDGDTVMVIPISKGGVGTKVISDKYPEELKNFSTDMYEVPKSSPLYIVDAQHGFNKQSEMGKVSNLITDMTLKGASKDEIIRAVKHSMVVIDAEKHHLDWRQSEIDNGIKELKTLYQGGPDRGASTLISKASSSKQVHKRKPLYSTEKDENGNPIGEEIKDGIYVNSGKKAYKETGETYNKPKYVKVDKLDENGDIIKNPVTGKKAKDYVLEINPRTGKLQKKISGYSEKETYRTQNTTWMADTDDANTLVSPGRNSKELIYADYANKLKALANTARKEYLATRDIKYDPSAKKVYAAEVSSLNKKLDTALMNAPRERQAQASANAIYKIALGDNPTMSDDQKKRTKSQILAEQRIRYGAKKEPVEITDREWQAIQAGAISTNKLSDIINNTDQDKLKERAMPKDRETVVSDAKQARMRMMAQNGSTQAEIAEAVGLSVSTVNKYI